MPTLPLKTHNPDLITRKTPRQIPIEDHYAKCLMNVSQNIPSQQEEGK